MDLADIAERVRYVGSPEHKDRPSFAGAPRPRADASICDASLADNPGQVTKWLREGIRQGWIGEYWEGDFPRYVWYEVDGRVFEGRLVNKELGQYKGYELLEEERPDPPFPQRP